jgi:1-pyrroline-5-carboxylate dehydrogenase
MRVKPFRNESFTDFSKKSNIEKQEKAIASVRKQLGKSYEMVVGGKKLRSKGRIVSYNPSIKDEVIAKFHKGTKI